MATKITENTLLPIGLVVAVLGGIVTLVLVLAPYFYDTKANAQTYAALEARVSAQEKVIQTMREQWLVEITEIKTDLKYIKSAVK